MREQFQFTHPGRGATIVPSGRVIVKGGSLHAPREGCDGGRLHHNVQRSEFQFTHPGRGATPLVKPAKFA